jgi:hypothetical protein
MDTLSMIFPVLAAGCIGLRCYDSMDHWLHCPRSVEALCV